MEDSTPEFGAWRHRRAALKRKVKTLRAQSLPQLEELFSGIIPAHLLSQADEGANSRKRVFPIRMTFFGFLYQVFKPRTSCREVVRQIQALFALQDRRKIDEDDSAYCQARNRLPEENLERIFKETAKAADKRTQYRTWFRHTVKVVDASSTSLDPKMYPADEIAALFRRRWRLELCFRDIKTSMGMEQMRCKSPEMVHKELLMYLIAHNLIRCLMAEAASIHDADLERISFKGSIDTVRHYSAALAQARNRKQRSRLLRELLEIIASDLLPDRPNRTEPRAVKRRPKPYALLNKHRSRFKETPHRGRRPANSGRK